MTAGVLDKWAVHDFVGWNPHAGQLEIAESQCRYKVAACGRRFGKSDLGGHELVPEALVTKGLENELIQKGKRREFWIVGPEYSDAEKEFRVLWNILSKLEVPMDKPGSYNNPESGQLHLSLWNGTFQVHGKSAKYPDTLVGEGLSGAILAEAAKLKPKVWSKYVRPTLADFNGWALMTSTPEGKNWFYEMWEYGQNPKMAEWGSWRMPAWRNHFVYKTPTYDSHVKRLQAAMVGHQFRGMSPQEIAEAMDLVIDDEILSLLQSTTIEAFNQEIGADFTEYVGRVFKEFDEEVHVTDLHRKPGWELYGAVDYGFTNPNVWLLVQVGPWGEVEVLDEIYEHGLTVEEFGDEILRRGLCPRDVRGFFPDPASPGDTRILSNKLRVRSYTGTGGELKWRIDGIRKALKETPLHVPRYVEGPEGLTRHPDRRPTLLIDRRCKMTVHEFGEYRYPDKVEQSSVKSQELPMKKDDHTPEALGRFFAGYFGTPQQNAGRSGTRKAKYGRKR
ncbi:terminase [Gordonia phage Genamy16]|uniref:Terminase n=2 Tax=Lambovirus TaxID=2843412 RepID=A0A9E7TV12_9CAUD|nr:terminase [Gordonia phage Genamy16]UVF61711.1 terminase [Gordonia phage NovaSharks]WNM65309.1 terminase [Gordonia phage Alyssamiracle]